MIRAVFSGALLDFGLCCAAMNTMVDTLVKPRRSRILLLSAYDAGSHARWREELISALPGYDWHTLTLPPRFFRWRIRGNPLSWLNEPLLDEPWDALVVTTMVDLATLRGLKHALARVPALAYCHENQFFYPQQSYARNNAEPQMVNLYTLLAAERIVFNSEWNRRSLLSGVETMMGRLPDMTPDNLQEVIAGKSCVIPVPIADELFSESENRRPAIPHLVWNHRWEHDKAPDRLLLLLRALKRKGFEFHLSVVGEQFRRQPDAFAHIAAEFDYCLLHWGFQSPAVYRQLLDEADVVLSTALHDFQGLAVLEAMAAGCYPWVPKRLAYPEYVPPQFLYGSSEADPDIEAETAAEGLKSLWKAVRHGAAKLARPDRYRQSRLIPLYRRELEQLIDAPENTGCADSAAPG